MKKNDISRNSVISRAFFEIYIFGFPEIFFNQWPSDVIFEPWKLKNALFILFRNNTQLKNRKKTSTWRFNTAKKKHEPWNKKSPSSKVSPSTISRQGQEKGGSRWSPEIYECLSMNLGLSIYAFDYEAFHALKVRRKSRGSRRDFRKIIWVV